MSLTITTGPVAPLFKPATRYLIGLGLPFGNCTQKNAIKILRNIRNVPFGTTRLRNSIFSIVDVVAVLTESIDGRNYWKVQKNRLKKEGSESVTDCN